MVYVDRRWPLRSDIVRVDNNVLALHGSYFYPDRECDALVISVHRGTARVETQVAITGKKSTKDRKGTILMLLLDSGQVGWIVSDGKYPSVTAE